MGFYGNISSINKSTFQFDKIYPNRRAMDDAVRNGEDDIFIGRYVLVDYDKELSVSEIIALVGEGNEDAIATLQALTGTEAKIVYGWLYVKESERNGKIVLDPVEEDNGSVILLNRGYDAILDIDDTSFSQAIENSKYTIAPSGQDGGRGNVLENGNFVFIKGYVVESQFAENGEIKRKFETRNFEIKGEYVLYIADEGIFVKATDSLSSSLISNQYLVNYQADKDKYPHGGRGYDSTVWQKTYKYNDELGKNELTYVMIAELNSVVPTLDLSVDAPTPTPLKPHWDTDSSNVYYKLHVQPNWGFRVKHINDTEYSTGVEYPEEASDIKGDYFYGNQIIENPTNQDLINHHTVRKIVEQNAPLAIYFNKEGFNRFIDKEPAVSKDAIEVLPTGKSLNQYYVSLDGTRYGDSLDTYELSVMLPSIGSAVSNLWDVLYGKGTYRDSLGNYLWDKTTRQFAQEPEGNDPGLKIRNTAFEWNTIEGRRMVHKVGNDLTYDMEDLNGVAGTINSLHDLLGMIIRTSPDINQTTVNKWDSDKIYFVPNSGNVNEYGAPGKYYYKQTTYNFSEIGSQNASGYYPKENVDELVNSGSRVVNSDGSIIAQYFRKSEEQYDSYKDVYERESGDDPRITYKYNNFYKVSSDADIDLNAVYGIVKMKPVTTLEPENYDADPEKPVFYKKTVEGTDGPITEYWLANEEKPLKQLYYNINWTEADEIYYYIKNKYYIGVKEFSSREEKEIWETEHTSDGKLEIEIGNYDYFDLCSESTLEQVLEARGIDKQTDFYRFYSGVTIDSRSSSSILIDKNARTCEVNQDNVTILDYNLSIDQVTGYYGERQQGGNFIKYYYRTKKAYLNQDNEPEHFIEELQNPIILANGNYQFKVSIYVNEKADEVQPKTLAEWDGDESYDSQNPPSLIIKRKLVPEYTNIVYSIENAIEIEPEKLKELEGKYTSLYFISETYSADLLNPREVYVQETLDKYNDSIVLPKGDPNKKTYYSPEITKTLVYYDLEGEYYYEDEHGNWIRETAQILRSDADISKYYQLAENDGWQPLKSGHVPFKANTYYKLNSDNTYSLIPQYPEDDSIDKYWLSKDRYVMEDLNNNFAVGAIWNRMIPTPNKAETGITLGYRDEKYEARELKDFAKYLNTIHGLILEINKKLLNGDTLTRDTDTVQGTVNKLNDIIDNFYEMIPGEILMVDSIGRVHSGDWDSKQKFGYDNIGNSNASLAVPTGEPTTEDNNRWIKLTTTSGYQYELVVSGQPEQGVVYYKFDDENEIYVAYSSQELEDWNTLLENEAIYKKADIKPHIKLEHTFNEVSDTATYSDKNLVSPTLPNGYDAVGLNQNTNDTLQLYTPIVDNMGHVIGKNMETVTLPYGFKNISTNGRESNNNTTTLVAQDNIVAENTQDTLGINSGNEWIKITTNPTEDIITISHDVKSTTNTTSTQNLSSESNSVTFNIPTYTFDETNHYASHDVKTLTMPNSYGRFTGDTGSSEATATHDTFSIVGDTWITSTVGTDSISLAHSLAHDAVTISMPAATSANAVEPQFGDTFILPDWTFDKNGHQTGVTTHTVKIPQGSLSDVAANGADVITQLTFIASSGALSTTRVNIGTLKLTGYSAAETNPLIVADDTINGAIKKLENALNNKIEAGSVNDSSTKTVYGIVNSAKLDLQGYVNQQISELTAPANPWGVQLDIEQNTAVSVLAASAGYKDGAVKINLSNINPIEYGSAYYEIVDGGIKIKTAGLYKVQGSAVFSLAQNAIGKVWIVKTHETEGTAISGSVESTGTFGNTPKANLTIPLPDTLVNLEVDDMIYLYGAATLADCSVMKNNLTYILLELLSAASQQNTEPEEPENNGGGE